MDRNRLPGWWDYRCPDTFDEGGLFHDTTLCDAWSCGPYQTSQWVAPDERTEEQKARAAEQARRRLGL